MNLIKKCRKFIRFNNLLVFLTIFLFFRTQSYSQELLTNSMHINSDLQFINSSKNKENNVQIKLKYLWNKKINTDWGIQALIQAFNNGAGYDQTYKLGWIGDYDYSNLFNENFKFGFTFQPLIGNRITSQKDRIQLTEIQGGGFFVYQFNKWPLSVRSDLLYNIKKIKASDSTSEAYGFVQALYFVLHW